VLGELSKLVSLSEVRFPSITCDNVDGVAIDVAGSRDEIVDIFAVDPSGIVRKEQINIAEDSAIQRIVLRKEDIGSVTE
jgi:hypothetical protein